MSTQLYQCPRCKEYTGLLIDGECHACRQERKRIQNLLAGGVKQITIEGDQP